MKKILLPGATIVDIEFLSLGFQEHRYGQHYRLSSNASSIDNHILQFRWLIHRHKARTALLDKDSVPTNTLSAANCDLSTSMYRLAKDAILFVNPYVDVWSTILIKAVHSQ
jgi:hypothetical protein